MSNHQGGLVDDIIEEGQYEAAIEMLFQLRSPQYKPSASHVRQLAFLALHPVSTCSTSPQPRQVSVTETPRKSRIAKVPSQINPKAIVSSLDLLHSLIATNTPESLGRALPSYASLVNAPEEQMDSVLAKQATCIKAAKHCWELLEEGFVFRNQVVLSPKGKSKLRRDYSIGEVLFPESQSGGAGTVADEAWPFLGWLLSLFEKDEDAREEREKLRYSTLFLEQLPPPRGGSTTRWDFSVVMKIVLCCMEQGDPRRRSLGLRLLYLLCNLTNTVHVEQSTLVNSVYGSLLATWDDPRRIQDFLTSLNSSPSAERFKISFCQKLLNDIAAPSNSLQPNASRPRPQARRPAPKPRGAAGAAEAPPKPAQQVTEAKTIASKYALPSCAEILQCLDFPIPQFLPTSTDISLILFARFQLVHSFSSLQACQTPETRLEWDRSIQEGKVAESLKRGFPQERGDDAVLYLAMLQECLRIVQ